jgi:hypothetical protein
MAKDDNGTNWNFEKGGYCPMNTGYTANKLRDFILAWPGSHLPKAPRGGTGESPAPAAQPVAEKPAGQ